MRNLVWKDLKPVLKRFLGTCDETLLLAYANESQERMLNRPGTPVGSTVRYRFCLNADSCLVLPRQIRTIQAYAINRVPGALRPEWYEFLPGGPGVQTPDDLPGYQFLDHGIAVAFNEVRGTGRYIRALASNAADAGKKIILKYYRGDTNEKVLTSIDGVIQEGEQLTLPAPPAYATTTYPVMEGGLYLVIKEETDYPVYLYEFNGSSNTQTLAYYEPSETVPTYRRMFLPGVNQMGGAACSSNCGDDEEDSACDQPVVTALVRLQHVPVALDNDPLVLGNVAAFKFMARACMEEDAGRFDESLRMQQMAERELEGELAAYLGDGMRNPVAVGDGVTYGAGNIPQTIGWGAYYG